MKCEYCGNPLSLETENCPHCGRLNTYGAKHAKEMRQYKTDYEQTKQEVYTTTKRFTQASIRVIIAAVMVILTVGGWLLSDNISSVIRMVETVGASIQKTSKLAQLDEYVENRDYMELVSFYEKNRLHNVVGYNSYYQEVYSACAVYCGIYLGVMELHYCKENGEDVSDYRIEDVAERVTSFGEKLAKAQDANKVLQTEPSNYEKMLLQMEQDLRLLFETYGALTKEEATSLFDMTTLGVETLIVERMVE